MPEKKAQKMEQIQGYCFSKRGNKTIWILCFNLDAYISVAKAEDRL
jgi:hypothetical protein